MNGRKIFGIFLMLFGVIMLVSTFTTEFMTKKFEKKLPDGVKKYDAVVSEVVSVESEGIYRENSNGDEYWDEVYNSDVVIKYTIDGQDYFSDYKFRKDSTPVSVGDKYIVQVHPDKPERIYSVSSLDGGTIAKVMDIVFGVIGGVIFVIGLLMLIKGIKMGNQPPHDDYYAEDQREYEEMMNGNNG